jgi:hypothetical protein
MKTAVISSVIEVDKDARKPKVFFFQYFIIFTISFPVTTVVPYEDRLNMEVDLQSLFGLHVT